MSTQFKNIRTQSSAIRAWGDDRGFVVVELQISRSNEKKEESMTGSFESSVHISDAYSFREGEWLAEFGTIKSMTGLSNKQIPEILERLKKLGKLGATKAESQWENICMLNGKLIFTEDLKNEKPKMMVVEGKPFADAVKKLDKIVLPTDEEYKPMEMPVSRMPVTNEIPQEYTEPEPETDEELDEWLDEVINVISEITNATPEQLQKLGKSLNLIGKELEDSGLDEEVDSLVETIESDEEDEMIEQCIEEIKKGNKPLINFFADLSSGTTLGVSKLDMKEVEKKQDEIFQKSVETIETPVKPDESPIANQIIQEATEKIAQTCPKNEQERHNDAIIDMVQKMQLMSTEDIEKLWDMWTRRQERLANQCKPQIIPKKSEPTPELSDNDWKEIDDSWEKDEKKYWKEMKELKKELEEMKEIEEKLEYTPPTKTWGPNDMSYSKSKEKMSEQEIAKGCKRQEDFLDRILDEIVFCEPMSPEDLKKKWENAWAEINKEWGRRAMKRRHKEQEESSRRDLFHGLSGKTSPWPMMNPRDPELWEPEF